MSFEVAATGPQQPFVAGHRGAQQSFLFFLIIAREASQKSLNVCKRMAPASSTAQSPLILKRASTSQSRQLIVSPTIGSFLSNDLKGPEALQPYPVAQSHKAPRWSS